MQLEMTTRGPILVISNDREILQQVLRGFGIKASGDRPAQAHYLARVRIASEREHFVEIMKFLDHVSVQQTSTTQTEEAETREPYFFSENIASLSRVLRRLESVEIQVADGGTALNQRVVYHLTK